MQTLKLGSKGPQVEKWQHFLIGQGAKISADGKFGPATEKATKAFQRQEYLIPTDGIVGHDTFLEAASLGFKLVDDAHAPADKSSANWPPKPKGLKPLVGNAARAKKFGKFEYVAAPTSGNREKIKITDDWAKQNIVKIDKTHLPAEFQRLLGNRGIRMHTKIADQFVEMVAAWNKAELLYFLHTWNGSYVPRFVRGSTKNLSNHSWGTAFDINVAWNRLGAIPARVGDVGSVRELVPIANKYGFFWGGHYSKRLDGMHFEAAKIL